MRVVARRMLREFWETDGHEDAEGPLKSWFREVEAAEWHSPADIEAQYASASILKNGRVVFNIRGNKYRLVAKIIFTTGFVYIRFIGTHAEYDEINVDEV